MSVRVEIQPTAQRELLALDAWWQEHRAAAASRVVDEYTRLIALLAETPMMGKLYRRKGVRNVRCMRLMGTPYKVYYHHASGSDLVTIVSLWSSMRGKGPPIEQLKPI